MAYLLGAQALVDSASNQRTAIHTWAERGAMDDDEVLTSVMSFSSFRYVVNQLPADARPQWERLYQRALARYRNDNLVDVTLDIALRAAQLRALSLTDEDNDPLGEIAIVELATALEDHLTLIDKRQPYHALLESQHGLLFEDPYTV